jgi:hypothetical protein
MSLPLPKAADAVLRFIRSHVDPTTNQIRMTLPSDPVTRCVVLIETRRHDNIVPLLRQVRRSLPDWGVLFIASTDARTSLTSAIDLIRAFDDDATWKLVDIGNTNLTVKAYNAIMVSPEFWTAFPAERALVIQTDVMICDGSDLDIKRLDQFEYVGAPWRVAPDVAAVDPEYNPAKHAAKAFPGGNGGFSVRSRAATLRVLAEKPYFDTNFDYPEDVYYSLRLRSAPRKLSAVFSVESVAHKSPFGLHKPWNHVSTTYLTDLECGQCPGMTEFVLSNGRDDVAHEINRRTGRVAGKSIRLHPRFAEELKYPSVELRRVRDRVWRSVMAAPPEPTRTPRPAAARLTPLGVVPGTVTTTGPWRGGSAAVASSSGSASGGGGIHQAFYSISGMGLGLGFI